MHAFLGSIWTEQIPDATAGHPANVCDLNSSGEFTKYDLYPIIASKMGLKMSAVVQSIFLQQKSVILVQN